MRPLLLLPRHSHHQQVRGAVAKRAASWSAFLLLEELTLKELAPERWLRWQIQARLKEARRQAPLQPTVMV